jgi:hypothetical protein
MDAPVIPANIGMTGAVPAYRSRSIACAKAT